MRWRDAAPYWDDLGARNPFGVILTGDDHEPRHWSVDAFFQTGVEDVARLNLELQTLAPNLQRRMALDFGCGVGRITRALATHFDRVIGLDVAPSMVAEAQRLNHAVSGCVFSVNRSVRLRGLASDSFDLVYSRLVLQHIPPSGVRRYIPELIRVLAPGGVLMFQLPEPLEWDPDALLRAERHLFVHAPITQTRLKRLIPRWAIRAYRRLRFRRIVPRRGPVNRMYTFGLAQPDVLGLLAVAGATIVRIDPDQSHGPEVPGYVYWVTKK